MRAVALTLLILATSVSAELFSFTDEEGQCQGASVDHWPPWYVPREPRHLYVPPLEIRVRIPVVSVIEMAAAMGQLLLEAQLRRIP